LFEKREKLLKYNFISLIELVNKTIRNIKELLFFKSNNPRFRAHILNQVKRCRILFLKRIVVQIQRINIKSKNKNKAILLYS